MSKVLLNGVKEGIFRGPDLSQQRRGFPLRKCTEHESPTKGHVGQNGYGLDVKPLASSSSELTMKAAMACSAETAGGHSTTVSGMEE